MKKILVFLLILFVFSSVLVIAQTKAKSGKQAVSSSPRFGNADGITASQLKNYLEFIASDELEGRDTPSRGLDIAAMYIANNLKRWGIKPAGENGTYFQKLPLKRHFIDVQKTKLEVNGQSFIYGEDFISNFADQNISGQLVYVGHGWFFKSKNIDAYQGLDVKDKIVVTVNRSPKGFNPADAHGKQSLDTWATPITYAQLKGAKAVISLSSFTDLVFWKEEVNENVSGSLEFESAEIHIPVIKASPSLINALFKNEKVNGSMVYAKSMSVTKDFEEPFELKPNKTISLNISVKTENLRSQNVIGVLEGSDPILKNEYVAIGAHYDHIGINPNAPGEDKIWNGADDDGSGTSAVLAIAEAFAKGAQRPKRSILFVWHVGEEKGLWGSQHFTEHPTVPIDSIVAQLNIDMIGRSQKQEEAVDPRNKDLIKSGDVYVVGSKLMSSELGELSESVNNSFLKIGFNYKYDDPKDPERIFYRSDHYNYAKNGIPIIFYTNGVHADYHQPSDSIEKIDFEQMEKIARTIFATAWELANRPTKPKVDKPLQKEGN